MRRLAATSIALLCALVPAHAAAFEREWHFGGGLGLTSHRHAYGLGPALSAFGAYGLSDEFDARVELLGSFHGLSGETGASGHAAPISLDAGLSYKLDVIRWIPYFGLLIGLRHTAGTVPLSQPRNAVEGAFLVGLDYAQSRELGFGLQVRTQTLASAREQGMSFSALLRAEYHFGF